jgi:hypothetical protein
LVILFIIVFLLLLPEEIIVAAGFIILGAFVFTFEGTSGQGDQATDPKLNIRINSVLQITNISANRFADWMADAEKLFLKVLQSSSDWSKATPTA